MWENINPLILSCVIQTAPATETESLGLLAFVRLSWFLQCHLENIIVT
jgi:hypothetical protein